MHLWALLLGYVAFVLSAVTMTYASGVYCTLNFRSGVGETESGTRRWIELFKSKDPYREFNSTGQSVPPSERLPP